MLIPGFIQIKIFIFLNFFLLIISMKRLALDEILKDQLDQLKPFDTLEVIILAGYIVDENGILKRNFGESQEDYNKRQSDFDTRSLLPIIECLKAKNTKYNTYPQFGPLARASLSVEQIRELSEMDYIKKIVLYNPEFYYFLK